MIAITITQSVSSFKDDDDLKSYKKYYLTTVEIKGYTIVIDGGNLTLERLQLVTVMIAQLDVY